MGIGNILAWLKGKKTYIIALVAAALTFCDYAGVAIPEQVYVILGALGLVTLRAGLEKSRTLALMLGVMLMMGAGCTTRAELVSVRESMDRGTETIRGEHLRWSELLAPVRGEDGRPLRDERGEFIYRGREELPHLQLMDLEARHIAHREYEANVAESRKGDRSIWIPFIRR